MANHKMPDRTPTLRAALHHCPVCHCPQTKIQRKLSDEKLGGTSYVCTRTGDCAVGIDLRNVETWVAV